MKGLIIAVASVIVASGCTRIFASNYESDFKEVIALKKTSAKPVKVNKFGPADESSAVNEISVRFASVMVSPNTTFSNYVEQAIITDLHNAGLYDPESGTVIDAELIKNDIDVSGFSKGNGIIEIMLSVAKGSRVLLKKTYHAETNFDTASGGHIAIPIARQQYPVLVRALLSKVYQDREFIDAVSK
jgi:hypothetical protein